MLENILEIDSLRGLARSKSRSYETRTVHPRLVDEAVSEGWSVGKHHQRTVGLRRDKTRGCLLEDTVWTLLYRMRFPLLSGQGGGCLLLNPGAGGPKTQIDVVGIEDELALAIECKSAETPRKRPQFQEELGKFALIRERFTLAIGKQYSSKSKRRVVLAMFVSNIVLTDNDRERAETANVLVFDDHDLAYYQSLVSHLGPAAKYQFFADMLPNKTIDGLSIRVPAVKTNVGGYDCYAFAISPEYLLKISYVSHRSKGRASDIDTYQRMLSKSRLRKIREYISNDGIFPTNIVVNLDSKRLLFEPVHQRTDKEAQDASGRLGWLDLVPTYKSAWIIDGQHRLFAYSGHEEASRSHLSVLAFEGLPPSKQAELFIDINAKQKSVKQSLLQELYAELHWDADDPRVRIRAIISKAIQVLDADPESPLHRRIQRADSSRSTSRCITLTSVYGAMIKGAFHVAKEKRGKVIDFGPLWAGDNDATLVRTVYILKGWLGAIRSNALDWWEKGAAEGGGLSMNDGIIACVDTLRIVFSHLEADGAKLVQLENADLVERLEVYARALGDYFASMSEQERKAFRDLRGIQGQTTRRRWCEKAINAVFPDFSPPGLQDFLQHERAETNIRAKEIVDRIETALQRTILEELQGEFGPEDSQWWIGGVPKGVRLKVTKSFEEDDGRRGGKECYFDLIDYRKIVLENWQLFEPLLGHGRGNKDKRTSWMVEVNEIRNLVAHASSGGTVSFEQLAQLQSYDKWLKGTLAVDDPTRPYVNAGAEDELVPS